MIIQKVGGHCFKLSAGPTTVALNPPDAKSKLKINKFGSDLVLVSLRNPDWDGAETATHGDKEPHIINGPGAYEVGDITISGFGTPSAYGKTEHEVGNTVYVFQMDGIRVLALGALATAKLPADLRAELDNIGIVLVPVGEGVLDPKVAHELMVSIEPKIIIPYGVGPDGDAAVKAFLKAEGETDVKPEEKLTVRAKEVAAMDGAVVLLQ
jgi:L-ascorbate metabolism protein UlaG (beta-lactamase superfamily)